MTKRRLQTTAIVLWGLLLAVCWPGSARAQAVTTSALSGRVLNEQQAPLPGARVVATNTATGSVSRVVTRSDGRYLLPGLQPGNYRVEVSGLGYTTQNRTLDLALGNTAQADFTLGTQALAIEGITAVAERNAVISPTRTGAASTVSDSTLRRTPTITRDLQDFTRLVPQLATVNSTTGAVSAGGRNNRFNQLQIDGTASNDLFGLSASGSPGGQAGAKTITLEAVQELQVVIAPFDVRQNGFTGASINAVTRSGTNRWQGSVSGFTRNESLAGRYVTAADTFSADLVDFQNTELAGSFGGPIVRDRAFFFVAGETTRRRDPTNYVAGLDSLSGISAAQAERVLTRLEALGYDPGGVGDRDIERESINLFGRLDFNLGQNHRLTLRHNYVDGFRDQFPRGASSFYLNNAGYRQNNTTNSSVVQLNSGFGGGIFNELRIGLNRVRDHRDYGGGNFPRIDVRFGNRSVIAGSENNSVANILDQDAIEITNDLTIPAGAHTITLGTSNEWAEFSNLFAANLFGNYRFDSYADFLAGRASQYDFRYLIPDIDPATPGDQPGNERAEFKYRRNSLYLQDRWEASDNFQLTAGIRLERQAFPEDPLENPLVFTTYGRHTSEVPSAQTLINPRIGFNWDVTGDQTTQIRGGFGLFSGRAPFVWISNAYGNTGLEYVSFRCTGTATPAFVADPNNQPRNCAGATTPAPNNINLVDPDLKLPQVSRWSLAIDRQLPLGLIGTLEGLYTSTIHDLLYRNLRIEPVPNAGPVEGRTLYRNRANTPGLGDVIDVTNTDEGYTYSITGQVQRPFRGGWDFSLAYTFSKAMDTAPLNNSTAFSNWSFNLTEDDPNNPDLTRSDNDIPHRIVATTSRRFNFFRRLSTDLSLVYVGQSGNPYSYRYGSDVNGDGSTGNDLIFVPADPTQIRFQETATGLTAAQSWRNLNNFIESVECLRESRGEIIERNACRAPWSNRFDFRLAQNLSPFGRSTAQLTIDILNVGNLLNSEWGRSDFVNNQADNLLSLVTGTNNPDANGRRLYQAFTPRADQFTTSNLDSRYQIQLGLRYSF